MKTGNCPKCLGKNVRKLHTWDRGESGSGGDLELRHYGDPEAWIFKNTTRFMLTAMACFDCGFVEFYLADPNVGKGIWEA